jgi:uncharacterized protein
MAFRFGGRAADTGIGFAGEILGGLAGLSGPIPILWASMRSWGKDERRGIFQTFDWTVLRAALCVEAGTGFITPGNHLAGIACDAGDDIGRLARRTDVSRLKR